MVEIKQTKIVYIFFILLVFSEARYTYNQVFKQSTVSIIKCTLSKGWYNVRDTLHHYKSQLSEIELAVLAMILGNSYLLTSPNVHDYVDTDQNLRTNDVRNERNLGCSLKEVDRLSQLNCTPREENQTNCARDIQRLFSNISNNIWTLQFLDSWGKPSTSILKDSLHFVGNYKQCRKAKAPSVNDKRDSIFNGKYCSLTISSKNLRTKRRINLEPALLQIGSCWPDSCSEYEITKMLQQVLLELDISSNLTVEPTECRTETRETTKATIAAIIIFSLIVAMMFCGTGLDILINWRRLCKRLSKHDEGIQMHSTFKTRDISRSETYVQGTSVQILLAFSVYTNVPKLLRSAASNDSLPAINGIRCFSTMLIVLAHVMLIGTPYFINVPDRSELATIERVFYALTILAVDNFFTISGLLVTYKTLKEMSTKSWKISWGRFYFHRFWRLTPPYMLSFLFFLGLQRFMGFGALWATVQPADKLLCVESWWTNLLYINNLKPVIQQCMTFNWYLAADMQFHIISPLMIIPFYFHVYAGVITCCIFMLAQWLITAYLSIQNDWYTTYLLQNMNSPLDYVTYYYMAPYCRLGPFVTGVVAGYILSSNNGRVSMNKLTLVFGWLFCCAFSVAVVYFESNLKEENLIGVYPAAIHNAVSRSAWGFCVCWIIVACSSGYGGPLNSLLSWSPFTVLSRLSYMVYLLHSNIVSIFFGNLDNVVTISSLLFWMISSCLLMVTCIASFIFVLAIESPMSELETILFKNQRKD